MSQRTVFLAVPAYGGVEPETATALVQAVGAACVAREPSVITSFKQISLLAHCFNVLWCEALNGRAAKRITHFAMLHSDVAPQPGWLPRMLEILDREQADVLSCVVPIKNDSGETSTAVSDRDGRRLVKLTEADMDQLPATFDSSVFSADEDRVLLVNTGLWVARLDRPWCEQVHFEIRDAIRRQEGGSFVAETMPEDWNFSLQLHRLGARVCATQSIGLEHAGKRNWKRDSADNRDAIRQMINLGEVA